MTRVGWITTAFLLVSGASASAHADETVAVAMAADGTMREPVTASIGRWLTRTGRHVAPPLSAEVVGTVGDCFVIEDDPCARSAIAHNPSKTVIFVTVEVDASTHDLMLRGHWLTKDRATVTDSISCAACSDPQLQTQVERLMVSLASGPAATAAPGPTPPSMVSARTEPARQEHEGLALGIELGDPTSATADWFMGKLGLGGAVGTGTFGGMGLSLHVDARYAVTRIANRFDLRVGGGGRYYHHGYQPASIDEIPDSHYGVRAVVEISIERGPLQLYAELAPGIDLKRTRSCNLVDGVDSICPHAQRTPLFINLVVGARWFALH